MFLNLPVWVRYFVCRLIALENADRPEIFVYIHQESEVIFKDFSVIFGSC